MAAHIGPAELINHIHAAMRGEGSWCTFLDEVRRIAPNGQAFLFYHDMTAGSGALSLSSGLGPESSGAYSTYYSRLNPFMPHAARRPLGRVVRSDDMLAREDLKRCEYYNDFLKPLDIETGFGVTVTRNGHCNFMFSIMCADLGDAKAEEVRACVQALVPSLEKAFRQARVSPCSAGHPLQGVTLDRFGILRLGPGGAIYAVNEVALRIVDSTPSVRIDRGRRLVCSAPVLGEAVAAAMAGWGSTEAFVHVLHLPRDGAALPLRVTVIRSAVDEAAFFRGPECLVCIEDPAWWLGEAVEAFGDMHGLTRAERRIVLALANGFSSEEIAEAAGISGQTVRSHLRHVFVRTGLHRQVDLVRHVCLLASASHPTAADGAVGLPAAGVPGGARQLQS